MTTVNSTALRCPNCGRRAVVSGHCSACGAGASLPREEIVCGESRPLATFNPAGSAMMPEPSGRVTTASPVYPLGLPSTLLDLKWIPGQGGEEVRGRVIIVRQGPNEPMDFDPWRWVAIPVWGIVLLISPLAIAILVWQSFGALPAFGVAVCSLLLLRFIFSDRLLQSWRLTAALNGRHIAEPMPVTMIRLRLSDSREVQMRLKGQLLGGTVIEGDRITAAGSWRSGVLHALRINCERTGATIVPQQPCARGLAMSGLCVLASAVLWFYLAGVPWVSEQVQSFRSSVQQRVQTINHHTYRP